MVKAHTLFLAITILDVPNMSQHVNCPFDPSTSQHEGIYNFYLFPVDIPNILGLI